MQVALLFLALVLAWPTYGLSLLAYLIYSLLRSYSLARTRRSIGKEKRSLRMWLEGEEVIPLWAVNEEDTDHFRSLLVAELRRLGVPETYWLDRLLDKDTFENYAYLAGAAELEGSTLIEQVYIVAQRIKYDCVTSQERDQMLSVPSG